MTDGKPAQGPMSAAELRAYIAERESAKATKAMEAKHRAEAERAERLRHFFEDPISEEEMAKLRKRIAVAVERGELEVLLGEFPATLTTDGGRAINNAEPDWPETLQGKVRKLFDIYQEKLQPLGYRLRARIENFPGGMPGNVGLYLHWDE